jgi:hypothetical protein
VNFQDLLAEYPRIVTAGPDRDGDKELQWL